MDVSLHYGHYTWQYTGTRPLYLQVDSTLIDSAAIGNSINTIARGTDVMRTGSRQKNGVFGKGRFRLLLDKGKQRTFH